MYFDIHLPSSAAQPQTARLYVDNTAENTAHPGPAQHPTVLAIHGVLCDHSVWQPLAPGLHALGWNMAVLDLPGHGRTPQQGNAPATHVVTLACGHQHMLDATPAMVQALADFVRS